MSAEATLIRNNLNRLDNLLIEQKNDLRCLANQAIEKANNDQEQHISVSKTFEPWVHGAIKALTEFYFVEENKYSEDYQPQNDTKFSNSTVNDCQVRLLSLTNQFFPMVKDIISSNQEIIENLQK